MRPALRAVAGALAALVLAAGGLGAASGGADGPAGLTAEEAVRQALGGHPLLRQGELDVGSAAIRLQLARSSRLPQADAGGLAKAGLAGSGNWFGLNGLAASPDPEGMAFSGNILQDLLDFKRSRFESAARQAEVEHFEHTLRALEARLALEVRQAFFSTLRAREAVALAAETLAHAALEARGAEALHRADLGARLDLDFALARLERARADARQAAAGRREALAGLNTLMGADPGRERELAAPETEPPAPGARDAAIAAALAARPEIAAVDAKIRAGGHWVRRARRERYPRVMAMFSGGWTRFAELTLGRLVFGGFGIRLPLLDAGRVEAGVSEAGLELERAEAAREELARAVAQAAATASDRLLAAIEAYRAAAREVAPAAAAERLERARYEQGLASRLEWSAAGQRLAAARSRRGRALFDSWIAAAELRHATGARP